MKATHYAVYDDNDNFLDLGTSEELQEKYNMTKIQIRQAATDAKRRPNLKQKRHGITFWSLGKMEV